LVELGHILEIVIEEPGPLSHRGIRTFREGVEISAGIDDDRLSVVFLNEGRVIAHGRVAGNDAGYKYVQAFNKYSDKVSFEQSTKKGSKEVYYSANELIDNIVDSLYDGMIIPINVGKISGTRKDYLYENLDLLIAAILDSGAEITNLRELLN
jgi:hypothetical protein